MKIGREEKSIAIGIIEAAADQGRFTKKEFKVLERVIAWLKNPVDDFNFSFSASYSNGGESEEYIISNDEECFRMEDIHHVYDPNVGGDTYTSFQYLVFADESQTEGDLQNFELSAIQLIQSFDDKDFDVDITITAVDS